MRSYRWCILLAAATFGLPLSTAQASTCYFVYDKSDTVIYRDQQPPVDMSARGAAARDAMRQRGEYLMFVDADPCAPLAFLTGPGTPGTLTVDQIVAGYPVMGKVESDSAAVVRRGGSIATVGAGAAAKPATTCTSCAARASSAYKK